MFRDIAPLRRVNPTRGLGPSLALFYLEAQIFVRRYVDFKLK